MKPPEKGTGEPRYPGMYRLDKHFRALFIGIGVFWACLAARNWVPSSVDYGVALEQAEAIRWSQPSSLYHRFEPFGYPALIRVLFSITGDYRLVGPLLSIISGLICLLALQTLWRRFDLSPRMRLVALTILALELPFSSAAISPGKTMLHLALIALACLPFCRHDWSGRDAFLTGLIIGFGSLNRYRMAWFLAAPLLRVFWTREPTKYKARRGVSLCVGFLLPVSVQLAINQFATGNPFGQEMFQLAYLSNHPDTGFWDTVGLCLYQGKPDVPPPGQWLLLALFGNAEGSLKALGQVAHVWALLLVPGMWSTLRGPAGWTSIRCYALVHGVFLFPLLFTRRTEKEILFLLPPAVLFGVWFLGCELWPHLARRNSVRRKLQVGLLALGLGGLATRDLVQLGVISPEKMCNLEADRFLERISVDPDTDLLQLGTAFCRSGSKRPFLYPIPRGDFGAAELTLERLKAILKEGQYKYLLAGRSSFPFEFPQLWALRERLAVDPQFELIESWDPAPGVGLYRIWGSNGLEQQTNGDES